MSFKEPSAEQTAWQRESEVRGPNFNSADEQPDPPRLIAIGAVPLSAAVTRAARGIGWTAYVVDPRERFAVADAFPAAEEVLSAWPEDAFERLGGLNGRTAVVALAHAPELDDEALTLALRSDAFYVGALGSRRTQASRHERLTAAGLSTAQLQRLRGPAGLDLGGDTIEEAALAIIAEAVAVLHARPGGSLKVSAGAIHPDGRP